jgi:hypothetical protein
MYDDRTLLGRAAHRHTTYNGYDCSFGPQGSSEFGFWLFPGFLSFRPRDCDTTNDLQYEIRVNANLPDDDLQTGYG